jgi:2,3-dihydroxybenzoate decarboxylase
MNRLIAIEEHLILPDDAHAQLWRDSVPMIPDAGIAKVRPVLEDVGDARLAAMDEAGITRAVLSNVGCVELISDAKRAQAMAREANDYMREVVTATPERYDAFATVSNHDPEAGAAELVRAVESLGLRGAMVFGPTQGEYLDHPRFYPFWDAAEALDVPIYLHPANPVRMPSSFLGREELAGALWGWTVETATHFLRLVFGGVFDRHPRANVILGHMGETVPYLAARFDSRAKAMGWASQSGKTPSDFLRSNLFVTTSGVFGDEPLRCAIDVLGVERVMFSLDYPFESGAEARDWFWTADLDDHERSAVSGGNASRILRLV